ncbi:hypothetical protein FDP41_009492 [Naegleria fowleri]|uniref:Probable enoyl-CoA hydratase, mitochondrial n=1 Tax=Naegleria fowleri TaxID=5763 RepID=A0A6A5BDN7_NAEFO|nr:uncharacterized protein FDP41_009492 [Naegleria fowleri]KAF0972184.1 hypothetical protein FDP41_009492 [Naegleria fowleri]
MIRSASRTIRSLRNPKLNPSSSCLLVLSEKKNVQISGGVMNPMLNITYHNNSSIYRSFSTCTFLQSPSTISYPTNLQNILFEKRENGVAIITLNRPSQLNALCKQLVQELAQVVSLCEKDSSVRVMIITGSKKAFAAGADIKEMSTMTSMQVYQENLFGELEVVAKARKPIIAAVNGYALGGGCELAMMCDFIIAGDSAKFGQPEIKLGTIPGIGGTQRLTKAIGKAKAMEWNLTGELYGAEEAEKAGLVSRIVKSDQLLEETIKIADKIASFSQPIAQFAKACVQKAHEMSLQEGLDYERKLFMSTFSTKDQKEGMSAFVEKRPPKFVDE